MLKLHLKRLLCPSPRPLEFILAVQEILYGGWLLLPMDTFDNLATFSFMKSIAPEQVWGMVIFTVGVIQFFGLFTNRLFLRRILGVVDLFLWLLVDLALWLGGTNSIAPIFIFTSVLAAFMVNFSLVMGDCRE